MTSTPLQPPQIAVKKNRTAFVKVTFALEASHGSTVALAGTFNGWDQSSLILKEEPLSGDYRITLSLPPGRYEYKFVIDGVWQADPACKHWTVNRYGTLNSVCEVSSRNARR